MAAIYMGSAAVNRADTLTPYTIILKDTPASADGTITSIEIWANSDISGLEIGIFEEVSANHFTTRSHQAIAGTITAGSKVTKNLSPALDVKTGDFIGLYFSSGAIERATTGEAGMWYSPGDHIPCTDLEASFMSGDTISLKGIGEEPSGRSGKISGVTNPAKVMGVDVANIAKVKGIA